MRTLLIVAVCLVCVAATDGLYGNPALEAAETAEQLFEQALSLYQNDGAEQDPALAVKLFRLAKDGGVDEAQYYLGLCYLQGRGVGKDEK
ncbi:MAG TPA: hypothetical protein PLB85_01210, partial [Candidatus Syntrophosphaera sp.]|nr:hypothetical protein [Candidatus Syntrophosphaera sp.]